MCPVWLPPSPQRSVRTRPLLRLARRVNRGGPRHPPLLLEQKIGCKAKPLCPAGAGGALRRGTSPQHRARPPAPRLRLPTARWGGGRSQRVRGVIPKTCRLPGDPGGRRGMRARLRGGGRTPAAPGCPGGPGTEPAPAPRQVALLRGTGSKMPKQCRAVPQGTGTLVPVLRSHGGLAAGHRRERGEEMPGQRGHEAGRQTDGAGRRPSPPALPAPGPTLHTSYFMR